MIPPAHWRRWWNLLRFNLMYLGRPPWDTNITPPEVIEVIEGGVVPSGRAVDLGCGTGTNAIYLARHGFEVIGVDSAILAIVRARRKARRAGVRARFHLGLVTRLDFLPWRADFALDIGCLHGLWPADRPAYAAALARAVRPGGHYLLYAWGYRGWAGLDPPEVAALFEPTFETIWVRVGQEHGLPSSWYLMRRLGNEG
ncbi:MAG: methyltransferase domain-containing protein [Anaerolineae bacterium]|nr:methyltransferase domain-containing protein [Anaerolineae bacterium]MDW8101098.1 methyltransferase domain-containing protein [Anaerolineae bacterium]